MQKGDILPIAAVALAAYARLPAAPSSRRIGVGGEVFRDGIAGRNLENEQTVIGTPTKQCGG